MPSECASWTRRLGHLSRHAAVQHDFWAPSGFFRQYGFGHSALSVLQGAGKFQFVFGVADALDGVRSLIGFFCIGDQLVPVRRTLLVLIVIPVPNHSRLLEVVSQLGIGNARAASLEN